MKKSEEILNILLSANLSREEQDFLKRFTGLLGENGVDFLQEVLDHNYDGKIEKLEYFLKNRIHEERDLYHEEIPGTEEALSHFLKSMEETDISLYTDSDNDGKHAMAMAIAFEKATGFKFKRRNLADTSIKSIDTSIKNTATHGLNSNQFISDYMKDPSSRPQTIMTADNGISSQKDIEAISDFCKEQNLKADFLITDHHLPDGETATKSGKNVTILDMELNKGHGKDTISGAETFGGVLMDALKALRDPIQAKKCGVEPISTITYNKTVNLIKAIGKRSAIADVIPGVKVKSEEQLSEYTQASTKHNRLRGFDYFLKNLPKESKYQFEAKEIEMLSQNFLSNIGRSPSTIKNNLYKDTGLKQEGSFTAVPHIQAYLIEIESKIELKIATKDEQEKYKIFQDNIEYRIMSFRKEVVNGYREKIDETFEFNNSTNFQLKKIQKGGISTAFANQIIPPSSREVHLTTRPLDKDTNILGGSFRSNNIKLMDLLTPELVEGMSARGITDIWIKGHGKAAGFNCKGKPGTENPEQIIFEEFDKAIEANLKLIQSDEKKILPELSKPDLAIYKKIKGKLGMLGITGDYEQQVTVTSGLDDTVVIHEGENKLIGGLEEGIIGYVTAPVYIGENSPQILSGLDDLELLKQSTLLYGNSQFSKIVEKKNYNIMKLKPSKIQEKITKLDNTIGEIQTAEEYMANHPLGKNPAYIAQIMDALTVGNLDTVSELDVEASGLGKAAALTNVGILTFYLDSETKKLMVERNAVLVKTPYPIDNAIETLTQITNGKLEEIGLEIDEVSEIINELFKGGDHEIRAYNSTYDLNILLSNLNEEAKNTIINNTSFTDTKKVAYALNLGSWSKEKGLIDIKDEQGVTLVKGARKEDYEKYMAGELDVITSVRSNPNLSADSTYNRVYRRNPNGGKDKIQTKPSKVKTRDVQTILKTTLAFLVNPENPYHYKQVTDYSTLEYVYNNLDKVSEETGMKGEEILKVIENITEFNENPTPEQETLMDKYQLPKRTDLYHEKHNNNDEMSDIALESAVLTIAIQQRHPEMTQEEINELYADIQISSSIINLPILLSVNEQTDYFHIDQLEKLGVNPSKKSIELKDISNPKKTPDKIYIKTNQDIENEDDLKMIKTLANLKMFDLEETEEYKELAEIVEGKGYEFKRYSSIKTVNALKKRIADADTPLKQKNVDNAIKITVAPLNYPKEMKDIEDIVLRMDNPEFSKLSEALPPTFDKTSSLWKKVKLEDRNLKKNRVLSEAKTVIHNNKEEPKNIIKKKSRARSL
jgi:hypothetical protein